jgi:hypothetical protein
LSSIAVTPEKKKKKKKKERKKGEYSNHTLTLFSEWTVKK